MTGTWRIWYTDGTTFGSQDGDPVDAPGIGVVLISQYLDGDRFNVAAPRIESEKDWYIFQHARWYATNLMGLTQACTDGTMFVLKAGRWVTDEFFADCIREASEWEGDA